MSEKLDLKFAGVQLKPLETYQEVVCKFIRTASALKIRFQVLEVFGIFTVGASKFVRFRTDCPNFAPIVDKLLEEGRATIAPDSKTFELRTPKGQKGSVGISTMQATPLTGFPVMFRGPMIKFWERQFDAIPQ